MSKSHQVPDWRRGAIYWRPLLDGREITIYPLTFGAARLCVGPLADEGGYDSAYRYETHDEAVKAADDWDPDAEPTPTGFSVLETRSDGFDAAPEIGDLVEVLPDDNFRVYPKEHRGNHIVISRQGRRGNMQIEGELNLDVDGKQWCRVDGYAYEPYQPERQGLSTVVNNVVGDEDPQALLSPLDGDVETHSP